MTMLTGKSRMTRHMEKVLETQFKPALLLCHSMRNDLGIDNKDEHMAAANFICAHNSISQFLTFYLRTQLDLHIKWTTESTFRDEAPASIAVICNFVSLLFKENQSILTSDHIRKLYLAIALGSRTMDFEASLRDMFKTCDLERMIQRYPDATKKGINIMIHQYKQFCIEQDRLDDSYNLLRCLLLMQEDWFPGHWRIDTEVESRF